MKKVVIGLIQKMNESEQDMFLLVKSKRNFGAYTGLWYPPGGHLEDGETEKDALIREVKEELNLDIVPMQRLAETPGDIEGQITYWWKCDLIKGDMKVAEELSDAKFFTKEEIILLPLWPATRTFFEKHLF